MTVLKAVVTGSIGLVLATACASSSPPQPVSNSSPAPSAAISAGTTSGSTTTSPAPTASEVPESNLPAFQCADQSGSASGGSITPVSDVRVGAHDGYDRFVLQFANALPNYSVARQSNAAFVNSPRGNQVTLAGTAGLLVTVKPIDWTSYSGTTQLKPGYTYLKEVRQVENFEGVQQWGLGVQGTPCVRVFTMTSPLRLVVDVRAA